MQDVKQGTNKEVLDYDPGNKRVNLDFDLLVNSVETSIMADQVEQTTVGVDPRQLLFKSNPGLYGSTTDINRDLTNPREMYSILSYRTKSNDDLTVRFKQELVKSIQTSGLLPKLTRTNSINDIKRNPPKSDRLGKVGVQSSLSVGETRLSNDQSGLRRHKTTVVDTRPRTDTEEKENRNFAGLPSIARNVHTSGGEIRVRNTHLGLPDLSSDGRKRSAEITGLDIKHSGHQKRLLQIKEELLSSDTKLDKWFSEMPNEVFDKAQRALMEESIKERLHNYQNKRNKRNGFPNDNVHVSVGSKVKKVPNTYLELRVDSFGKHLLNEKGDKLNKYKLQQKSMHKLKMREIDEFDKPDRIRDEVDFTPRLSLHHRSLTTLALSKAKTASTMAKNKPEVITIPTDRAMNTVNINESVELDEIKRERKHLSYFEEYTERLNMMKIVADQHEELHLARPNSACSSHGVQEQDDSIGDKSAAKPNIVNIALEQNAPKKRNPIHITKTIHEKEIANKNQPNIENHVESNETVTQQKSEDISTSKANITDTDLMKKQEKCEEPKQGTIITMIPTAPTAQSSRTSTSSSIRSLANKSPLKKFNTLEVFAEHSKLLEARMEERNYHGHKLRDSTTRVMPPSVKLDLKSIPNQSEHQPKETIDTGRSEVKMQDVVFRFEPGEVFITTKKPKQVSNSNNRSSERARIIYGKALQKDDKKEGRLRENSKENFSTVSLSTRFDGYKSELGRFESRALEGSITSLSGKDEPTEQTYVNNNGVFIRDVAIETEVLGPEKSPSAKQNDDKDTLKVDHVEHRTGSGLTDFILDDNDDGESLDSTSNVGGHVMDNEPLTSKNIV